MNILYIVKEYMVQSIPSLILRQSILQAWKGLFITIFNNRLGVDYFLKVIKILLV